MKSKKHVRGLPQPEECGVWLDASQLKKRPHQTVISCTSSRFNPLRRRQSTDSVLVDCTIKSSQLCTKQTSMYSFFSPTGPSTCLTQTYREHEKLEIFSSYKIQSNTENKSSGQIKTDWSCVLDKPGHSAGYFPNASRAQKKSLKPPTNYGATSLRSKTQNNLSDALLSTCPQGDYKEESLFLPSQSESQLFTQDTQGNKVICHRFPSERPANTFSSVPLLDKTNVTWDTRSPMKGTLQTVCDEEALNNMFTQDSEGNMVIKH
ncbi:aurora kinase A- and ninein-interacting protein isoform X2 [Ranitomeya variabilis]|uniref:aurora kinase A- and ninein-interacting protein isoform X2 n=1 Tax=Ranitomeya variabilis TaxID=490064 RepID=UPI0040576A37